jgi:hypothetical protein
MGRVDPLEEIARELIMRVGPALLAVNARPPEISVVMHTDNCEYYVGRYAASYGDEVFLKFKGSDYKRAVPNLLRDCFFTESRAIVCNEEVMRELHIMATVVAPRHLLELNFDYKSKSYQAFEMYIAGKVRMQQCNSAQQSAQSSQSPPSLYGQLPLPENPVRALPPYQGDSDTASPAD